jgi:hypothetical protein
LVLETKIIKIIENLKKLLLPNLPLRVLHI